MHVPCYVPLFTSSNGICCDEKTILTYKQGFGSFAANIKIFRLGQHWRYKTCSASYLTKHLPVCSTRVPFFVLYSFKPSKGKLCKRCQRWLTLLDVLEHKQYLILR